MTTNSNGTNGNGKKREPEIGDTINGHAIGMKSNRIYIWWVCLCGKGKWTALLNGEPENKLCKACAPKANGSKSSRWIGGKIIKRVCEACGKEFDAYPSVVKLGWARFCSYQCRAKMMHYRRNSGIKPNGIEQSFIELLGSFHLPFKYVGNGEVWLGNRNPDFINTNGKKQVIELLGTYWHPLFDGANRIEHYKQYGFDCLAIWEDEFKNPLKLGKKVKVFSQVKSNGK